MKYTLILWAFWTTPIPHWEGVTVSTFDSYALCEEAGEKISERLKADGVAYIIKRCEYAPEEV